MGLRVTVLGPVRVFGDDGEQVDTGGAKPRMLLARLALSAGETVSPGALIADIWGTDSPSATTNTLHALVHRLRRALPEPEVVESPAGGYRLALPADSVDAHRFEVLTARGRRELLADAPEQATATLGDALALWHGDAFADILAAPYAGIAGARLEELRAAALEDRFEAELRLGRHSGVLPDLEAACAGRPLRERLAALRMRALSAAGRQSEALAAYEDIRGRLAVELGVDPSAVVRQAHLAVLRGEVDRTTARSGPTPGRLPSRLTSFVGRGGDSTLLADLMETSRLVTVAGTGGVGKTRLALEVASRHPAYESGRLWLVPLAGVEKPEGVADAVLGALSGARLTAGATEPLDRAAILLGGDDAVLVLDNCEHLVAEVARVAQYLLETRPRLTVLATSREPLDVLGEALCRLDPLDLPAEHTDPGESAAVRLFTDRAAAVQPGFALTESTVDSVVEVVRRLDGLPLALELAAARLRSMTVGQVARHLDDRFRLLSTGNRAALPRQRTLRAVIEWSWDLLSDRERTVARRLAFFPATATFEAIEAVCSDTLYVLDSLVGKSLVERGENGYRMLESIRAFAAEELSRAGERDMIQDRYLRHFAALAAEHEALARSHSQHSSLAVVAAEYDNLVFALRVALDGRDADAVVRLLGLLHWYWYAVRYDARTESLIAEALTLGDALPRDARATFAAIDALIGENAPCTDPDRMRALVAGCSETGAFERYPFLLLVTLPLAQQMGLDDLVAAEMARARNGSDAWAWACVSLLEATAAGNRGDWANSAAARGRAAAEFAETGDRLWTAVSTALLAEVHLVRGDHDAAIAALEHSVGLSAGSGSQDQVAHLVGLAAVRMRAGDLDGAGRDIDAAEDLTRALGLRYMEFEIRLGRAEIHRRSGEFRRSERELDELAALARRLRLPEVETVLAPARFALRLTTGDADGARELLPAAIAAAQANRASAPAAQQLARLLFLEDDPVGAATALGLSQAIRGAFDHGDPELRDLVAELVRRLGERGYDNAFRAGAQLTWHDATTRLAAHSAPVSVL
ncbi:BTAD domain-containing putative transcriptional regulator [Amycolatopsis sp. cmx-11-12]|uniref:BTAD domain-containing putative transcriptional regulator n=1 Tax=Amycolatopsis sp. cmx-11-12 TaxID=2785795 RepID=UPI0039182144